MTEREELKPCPFCGGRAEMGWCFSTWSGDGKEYWISCTTSRCISLGYSEVHDCEHGDFDSEEGAISAWNRRAEG